MSLFNPAQLVENIPRNFSPNGEKILITPTAGDGQIPVFEMTFPAAASITQADHVLFEACNGDILSLWLDIDADTTEPTGAAHATAAATIPVAVVLTGTPDTGEAIAAKVKTAIENAAAFDDYEITITVSGAKVTVTGNIMWEIAQPQSVVSNELSAGSVTISGYVIGAESTMNSTTLTLNDGSEIVLGLNINGEGAATADVEATFDAAASTEEVGAALATAIDSLDNFEAHYDGGKVHVLCTTNTNVSDAADVDTGFTIAKVNNGYAGLIYPSLSPESLSVEPSVIS